MALSSNFVERSLKISHCRPKLLPLLVRAAAKRCRTDNVEQRKGRRSRKKTPSAAFEKNSHMGRTSNANAVSAHRVDDCGCLGLCRISGSYRARGAEGCRRRGAARRKVARRSQDRRCEGRRRLLAIPSASHRQMTAQAVFSSSSAQGKIKVVTKDGKVNEKPFLDLTKNSPLGSEVQTGFVEQGLWPSPSIRSSRRTATSSSATRRCRSTARTSSPAIRSTRRAPTW